MVNRTLPRILGFSIKLMISLLFILSVSCERELMPFIDVTFIYDTSTVTDVEGNVYKTVRIGDQWWMSQNLKVRRYTNNVPLYYNSSYTANEWANLKTGAYCNLGDQPVQFNGALYNWYAVSSPNGLAPDGWRIPTDEDWKKLEIFLGMLADSANMTGWRGNHIGEKLKTKDAKYNAWKPFLEVSNTNQSGFSALPGGCRIHTGSFGDMDQYDTGFWWSSSEYGSEFAWYRYLDFKNKGVFRYYSPKTCGYSIRCVKDVSKK